MRVEQPKDYVQEIIEDVTSSCHHDLHDKVKFRLSVTFAFAIGFLVGTFLF